MQKLINVLAITSFAMTASVAGAAGYVYLQREKIAESIRETVMKEVTGAIPAIVESFVGEAMTDMVPEVPAVETPVKQMELPVSPLN